MNTLTGYGANIFNYLQAAWRRYIEFTCRDPTEEEQRFNWEW